MANDIFRPTNELTNEQLASQLGQKRADLLRAISSGNTLTPLQRVGSAAFAGLVGGLPATQKRYSDLEQQDISRKKAITDILSGVQGERATSSKEQFERQEKNRRFVLDAAKVDVLAKDKRTTTLKDISENTTNPIKTQRLIIEEAKKRGDDEPTVEDLVTIAGDLERRGQIQSKTEKPNIDIMYLQSPDGKYESFNLYDQTQREQYQTLMKQGYSPVKIPTGGKKGGLDADLAKVVQPVRNSYQNSDQYHANSKAATLAKRFNELYNIPETANRNRAMVSQRVQLEELTNSVIRDAEVNAQLSPELVKQAKRLAAKMGTGKLLDEDIEEMKTTVDAIVKATRGPFDKYRNGTINYLVDTLKVGKQDAENALTDPWAGFDVEPSQGVEQPPPSPSPPPTHLPEVTPQYLKMLNLQGLNGLIQNPGITKEQKQIILQELINRRLEGLQGRH